jgi:GT2 family glycosyltransferase
MSNSKGTIPTPSVSVVVCAHNEAALIQRCLHSLAEQAYPADRYEVLVVDDASRDETGEITRRFIEQRNDSLPVFSYLRIEHGGLSVARNTGIQNANHDIVAFIDGDAIAEPGWLQELTDAFASGADFVGGRIELLNSSSRIARFSQLSRHLQIFEGPAIQNHFVGCNMAFRREVLSTAGGFIENFVSRGDESTLYQRIKDHFTYGAAPDAVVFHERPDSLRQWARVEWQGATLRGLTRLAERTSPRRRKVAYVEMAAITILPLALPAAATTSTLGMVAAAVSSAALLRRALGRPGPRVSLRALSKEYGWPAGILLHLGFVYVSTAIRTIGTPVGLLRWRSTRLVQPMTTQAVVQERVTNATHSAVRPLHDPVG